MPTTMAVSVVATRSELSLPDLELNDGISFRIVTMGPGARGRRNTYAKSGNVHGGTLTNSVLDVIIRPLVVRVLGTSQTQLDANTLTLIETVEQWSYTLTESKNGVATVYTCMTCESITPTDPAGSSSEEWDKFQLMAPTPRHVYRINVPTAPQPTTGPI